MTSERVERGGGGANAADLVGAAKGAERAQSRAGGERLHALDAVRGGALVLGVLFHAAFSFLPGSQIWIVADASRSVELSVLIFCLHVFRMLVFFFIAGFFARMLLQRRGVGGFVANRLTRVGVPLLVGWPIVLGCIIATIVWVAIRANGGAPPANAPPPPLPNGQTFPLTHLWFLYVLIFFYAGALMLRGLVVVIDRSGVVRTRLLDPIVRAIAGPAEIAVLAAVTASVLYCTPEWIAWFGIPTPDTGLIPNATALIVYGFAFGFGWVVSRQPNILQSWARLWLLNLALGAGAMIACLFIVGPIPVLTPFPYGASRLVYAALYGLAAWGWTLGLIGAAVRYCSGHSAVRRYVADASYWIYIVHLPLVMGLQAALAPLPWPWFAKYPLILGVAFALMLGSYQLFVRYSFIGAILNGRRKRPQREQA